MTDATRGRQLTRCIRSYDRMGIETIAARRLSVPAAPVASGHTTGWGLKHVASPLSDSPADVASGHTTGWGLKPGLDRCSAIPSARCIRSYDRMGIETSRRSSQCPCDISLHPVIRPDGD